MADMGGQPIRGLSDPLTDDLNAAGNGIKNGGPSDVESLSTNKGSTGNRRVIGPDEDAQEIIEAANPGDVFYLSAGATYKYTPPFDIPGEVAILNGVPTEQYVTGNAATFQKDGDGQVNLTGQKIKIGEGILFDGRGSTFTGHGIVEELSGTIRNTLSCSVINMEGDGVRLDSFYDSSLGRLISSNNDGHGLVFTDVGESHNSQITSDWMWVSANGDGGIRVDEDILVSVQLNTTLANNGGPGFHSTENSQIREANSLTGWVTKNDGPALLFDDFIDGLLVNVNTTGNNQNPSISPNKIGEVHFSDPGAGFITLLGTITESAGSDAVVVNQSSKGVNVFKSARFGSNTEPAANGGTGALKIVDMFGGLSNSNTSDTEGFAFNPGAGEIERLNDGLTADFS